MRWSPRVLDSRLIDSFSPITLERTGLDLQVYLCTEGKIRPIHSPHTS